MIPSVGRLPIPAPGVQRFQPFRERLGQLSRPFALRLGRDRARETSTDMTMTTWWRTWSSAPCRRALRHSLPWSSRNSRGSDTEQSLDHAAQSRQRLTGLICYLRYMMGRRLRPKPSSGLRNGSAMMSGMTHRLSMATNCAPGSARYATSSANGRARSSEPPTPRTESQYPASITEWRNPEKAVTGLARRFFELCPGPRTP